MFMLEDLNATAASSERSRLGRIRSDGLQCERNTGSRDRPSTNQDFLLGSVIDSLSVMGSRLDDSWQGTSR